MEELRGIVAERVDTGPSTGIAAGVVLPDGRTRPITHGECRQRSTGWPGCG
jgi:hypothetical protein